jgi:hypothetical protein
MVSINIYLSISKWGVQKNIFIIELIINTRGKEIVQCIANSQKGTDK